MALQSLRGVCSLGVCTGVAFGSLSAGASCPADLNGDGSVSGADIGLLLAAWGTPGPGDLNSSGNVDGADLGLLLAAWGPCPVDVVLEPATMHMPPAAPIGASEMPSWADDRYGHLGTNGHGVDVYDFSGESVVHAVDMRVRGRGLDFVLTRKYRSRQETISTIGSASNWDFSYNIWIEQSGADLILHDGNTRSDVYTFDPGTGTWSRDGHFRLIEQDVTGEYVVTFAHRGTWRLHAITGAPHDGRISEITDRNGNTLGFSYDGLGRLSIVRDTLHHAGNPREYLFAYDGNGFLSSVTDFTGRQVTYEYYDGIIPGGSFGDLMSVVSTPVVGTSTQNDFPTGKTTTYEWTFGTGDTNLDHNLSRVRDAKGQAYSEFEYDVSATPADANYDRVDRQVLGDPGDWIDRVYIPQNPGDEHPESVLKIIVNDRVGHVTELLYDDLNRIVELREFTGSAPNPDAATDETTNRPTGQVRVGDPPVYVTNYEYNADSLRTRTIFARGNSQEVVYDSLNPNPRSRGNALLTTFLPGVHPADQASIVEVRGWDPIINGDTNKVTSHTDGRGNSTQFQYDPNGNVLHVDHRIPGIVEDFTYNAFGQMLTRELPENDMPAVRRLDQFTYYGPVDGVMNGYQRESIIDSLGFALTTTYEYDSLGRVTRTIDPKGNDTLYEINQLDQVVRVESRPVTLTLGPTRYHMLTYYDANDNVVRVDRSNIDRDGNTDPNDLLTRIYVYDILDNLLRAYSEEGVFGVPTIPPQLDDAGLPDSEFVRVEYDYDDNENLIEVRNGEASEGRQPDNRVELLYDERDLVYREIRAPGAADQSTTQYDYDENANRVRRIQGVEDVGNEYVYVAEYDGYDRLIVDRFEMGSVLTRHYDANGNVVSEDLEGEILDLPGDAGNVPMSATTYTYDNMDRVVLRSTDHFDLVTQTPIGDGARTTQYVWTPASRLVQEIDDHLHTTVHGFDTSYRYILYADAKGNSSAYTYDPNSNVVRVESTEKSDNAAPDQIFETMYEFDDLDRLIKIIDGWNNTRRYEYDSRGNRVREIDPDDNETTYEYDSMDRRIRKVHTMTDDGTGSGTPIGLLELPQTYDDSNRLVTSTDGEGNTTSFDFDALNRMIQKTHADGSFYLYTYDVHHNLSQQADPSGTISTHVYDLLGRRTDISVVPGPGVSNETTFVQFEYDGVDNPRIAADDDSVVTFEYDSLGNVLQETNGAHTVLSTYDGESNRLSAVYPSGIEVVFTYNEIELIESVTLQDGVNVVPLIVNDYVGNRYERQTQGNGIVIDHEYNGIMGVPNAPGDFGFRRRSGSTHTGVGPLLDLSYLYDPRQNKSGAQLFLFTDANPREDRSMVYDSVSRLTQTDDIRMFSILSSSTMYDLDLAGNRDFESGTGSPGAFFLDPTSPPDDERMNQYTLTPRTEETHSARGERTTKTIPHLFTISQNEFNYDNKLVENSNVFGIFTYFTHDALGRRTSKTVDDGITIETETYVHDGKYLVETWDGPLLLRFDSYDRGCDDTNLDAFVPWGDLTDVHYAQRDDLGSVRMITDSVGNAVEFWRYGDYGEPRRGVYNHPPDQFGAASSDTASLAGFDPQKLAENFQLTEDARIATLEWSGGYAFSAPASIPSDDFTIRFYDDNAGVPGTLLHEENVGEVGRVKSGLITTINSVDEYLYITRIEMPPSLQSGLTYWISIENDLAGTGNVWGWMTSAAGDGISAVSVLGGSYAAGALNLSMLLSTDISATGNTHLFQSKWYDPETRLYYNNARYLDPQTGRFITRDPLGLFGDADNLGNGYTYVGNNPYTFVDSSGFMPGPVPTGNGRPGGPPMFGSPANSPTSPTTPAPSPPKLPTTEDGPRLPGTGRPSKPAPAEQDYLDKMLERSLERLRHQWGSSAGYGYGGGIYSPPGVASGSASKGNAAGTSGERCEGADDDCGTDCDEFEDVISMPASPSDMGIPHSSYGKKPLVIKAVRVRTFSPYDATWDYGEQNPKKQNTFLDYCRGTVYLPPIRMWDWRSPGSPLYSGVCAPAPVPPVVPLKIQLPLLSGMSGSSLSNTGIPNIFIGGDVLLDTGDLKPIK